MTNEEWIVYNKLTTSHKSNLRFHFGNNSIDFIHLNFSIYLQVTDDGVISLVRGDCAEYLKVCVAYKIPDRDS